MCVWLWDKPLYLLPNRITKLASRSFICSLHAFSSLSLQMMIAYVQFTYTQHKPNAGLMISLAQHEHSHGRTFYSRLPLLTSTQFTETFSVGTNCQRYFPDPVMCVCLLAASANTPFCTRRADFRSSSEARGHDALATSTWHDSVVTWRAVDRGTACSRGVGESTDWPHPCKCGDQSLTWGVLFRGVGIHTDHARLTHRSSYFNWKERSSLMCASFIVAIGTITLWTAVRVKLFQCCRRTRG